MNVLIAFDKFKDSLTAEKACHTAARVIGEHRPSWRIECTPLTDGGDGFCRILTEAANGELVEKAITGPRFARADALMGLVDSDSLDPSLCRWLDIPERGRTAIIEMAQASGLAMLKEEERDLWKASSIGTGELIACAHRRNADSILLGVGGSATNDLGLGALQALGLRFFAEDGEEIERLTPHHWPRVSEMSGAILKDLPPIRIACDVENPLLGENGAAAVYGPQKGLKPEDWERIDQLGARLARSLCSYFGADFSALEEKGSGAAGGISFGLRVACGARIVSGFELVARWLNLEERIRSADLILTGEGKLDRASFQGKGPGTIIKMATRSKKRAWVFSGLVDNELLKRPPSHLRPDDITAICPPDYPLDRSLAEAKPLLEQAIRTKLLSLGD